MVLRAVYLPVVREIEVLIDRITQQFDRFKPINSKVLKIIEALVFLNYPLNAKDIKRLTAPYAVVPDRLPLQTQTALSICRNLNPVEFYKIYQDIANYTLNLIGQMEYFRDHSIAERA